MNSPELGPQPVAPHQLGELARKLEAIIPFCEQPYLEYGNTSLVYSFGEPQPTLSDDNPTESFTAYNIIIDLNINGLSQDDTQAAQSFYEAINRFYSIEKEEGELNKDGASIKKTTVWSMFVTDDLEQDPLEAPYQEVKFDISYNEGLTWQGVTSELDKLIRLRFALTVKSLKGITDQSTIDQIAALDSEIAKIENEKRNFETQLGLKPEGEYDQNEHAALMDIVNSVHRALDIQEN